MDIDICSACIHHRLEGDEHWCYYPKNSGTITGLVAAKCKGIHNCGNFIHKHSNKQIEKWGHYEFSLNPGDLTLLVGSDQMRNDNFETTLRSYDKKKSRVLSVVEINCEDYEVFKKVVEAVMPILEKEDIEKECE